MDYVSIETDWFGEPLESAVSESGILIGDNGVELLVLVSAGSAAQADRIDVTVGKTTIQDVSVLSTDAEYDLSMLSVPLEKCLASDRRSVEYTVFGESKAVKAGDPVILVGSPDGYMGTYRFAMVTNTGNFAYVTDNRFEIYNTDLPENALGSGVFVNTAGEVVGILTHGFKEARNENITTMIAVDGVRNAILSLANGTARNYLGVVTTETPAGVLKKLDIKYGLYVTEVKAGSPAEAAGIKKGDILVKIGDKELKTADVIYDIISETEAGETLTITLIRNTKPEEVEVVIGGRE